MMHLLVGRRVLQQAGAAVALVLGSLPAVLFAAPAAAPAPAGACDTWEAKGRYLMPVPPLAVEDAGSAREQACLVALAAKMKARKDIVQLTVEAQVPSEPPPKTPAITWAKDVEARLLALGVEKARLSSLAPPVVTTAGLWFRAALQPPEAVGYVGVLWAPKGPFNFVRAGAGAKPVAAGMTVLAGDVLVAAAAGNAKLVLDGGHDIHLAAGSRVTALERRGRDGAPASAFKLDGGQVWVQAAHGLLEMECAGTVLTARDAIFRLTLEGGVARLETLAGTVAWTNAAGVVTPVGPGNGATLQPDKTVSPLVALVAAPQGLRPARGALPQDTPAELNFKEVKGAQSYRVELARDAAFLREDILLSTAATTVPVPASLAPGAWYWRVIPTGDSSWQGMPSKVFSFDVPQPQRSKP